jgi:ribonucleoside-diphosphate reductase beta chain
MTYTPPKQSIIHGPRFSSVENYGWALDKRDAGQANHWLAHDISMARDIEQWKTGQITEDEKLIVKRNLGFFVTADSLAANNIVLGTLRHIRAEECRKYLVRQAYEEAVHTEAYQYIVESLGLDEAEIFNAYHEVPSIRAKDEFLLPYIDVLTNPNFETGTFANDQALLKSIFAFGCVMEGLFFYVGFVQILALGRQNKMVGAAKEYQYILRDESGHCNYGIDLFNTIRNEIPALFTPQLQEELADMMRKGVELELGYAKDTMPRGVLGLNVPMFENYLKFIANRRMSQCAMPLIYEDTANPFEWMAEMIDLQKEENFFETR